MARAHCNKSIIRKTSGLPADGTCQVYEPGTTTPIAQTIYVGDTGAGARANPFAFVSGIVDFYLDLPQRVDLVITPTGGAAQTFPDVDIVAMMDFSEDADIQMINVGGQSSTGTNTTEVAAAGHIHGMRTPFAELFLFGGTR